MDVNIRVIDDRFQYQWADGFDPNRDYVSQLVNYFNPMKYRRGRVVVTHDANNYGDPVVHGIVRTEDQGYSHSDGTQTFVPPIMKLNIGIVQKNKKIARQMAAYVALVKLGAL